MASENEYNDTSLDQTDTPAEPTPEPAPDESSVEPAGPPAEDEPASAQDQPPPVEDQPSEADELPAAASPQAPEPVAAEPAPAAAPPRKRASRRTATTHVAPPELTEAEPAGAPPTTVGQKTAKAKANQTEKPAKAPERAGRSKSSRGRKKNASAAEPLAADQPSLEPQLDLLSDSSTDEPRAEAAAMIDEAALRFDALAPSWEQEHQDDLPLTPEETTHGTDVSATPYGPLFQAPVIGLRRRSATASEPEAGPEESDELGVARGALPIDTGIPTVDGDTSDLLEADGVDSEESVAEPAETDTETPRRRRRRGGKGRRSRSAGAAATTDEPDSASQSESDERAEEPEQAALDGEADGDADSTTTRRRTRRRRRSSGAETDSDKVSSETGDAPGVTTKVRESRRDEVTALKGSTRLEAKKQRRREGREAGRRRTIITEAEFLARRESVERVMVVRHLGDRTQIGVLEDGVLVEHYISRETTVSMAGNIYLGRVQNVLPSMEAAFVDIGKGRNAVLYAGEVNWDAAGLESNEPKRIENALTSGESVLVQVTKDPMGHKGARLTSQISLPGRYLVYVPNSSMTGISRKLPDTERSRLKKILKEVVPDTAGVIVRTAAEGASEEELRADVERLTKTWADIVSKADGASTSGKKKSKSGGAPLLLHGEPDLTVRVIRDIFNEDFASLVVAGEEAWGEVSDYVTSVAPDLAERVVRWTSDEDLFSHYRVDEQIAKAMDRKVWLPSGGSLVIDRTEAMTVVDVNTGKFIGSGGNLEETVTKNNLEAAEEIVRQLRLRDIGGIIVIDFIDMVLESNRDLVVRRLLECLGRDRTKHQVAEVTSLGLVQMTRKRVGSGLIEVFSEMCEACGGRGILIHGDPVDKSGNGSEQAEAGFVRQRKSEPLSLGRPSGPTPAQIAAAAHAAALKTALYAEGADVAPDAEAELVLAAALTERLVEQDVPVEILVETDTADLDSASEEEAPSAQEALMPTDSSPQRQAVHAPSNGEARPEAETQAYDVVVPPDEQPDTEETAETEESAPAAYAPQLTPPVTRPRRHRGRVVAPAGPPRSVGHGEPLHNAQPDAQPDASS